MVAQKENFDGSNRPQKGKGGHRRGVLIVRVTLEDSGGAAQIEQAVQGVLRAMIKEVVDREEKSHEQPESEP